MDVVSLRDALKEASGSSACRTHANPLIEACYATSSKGTQFLVVSDSSFVATVAVQTLSQRKSVLAEALRMIEQWESNCDAAVLADFEGENLGWGGELLCAQFLPTTSLNPATLMARSDTKNGERTHILDRCMPDLVF